MALLQNVLPLLLLAGLVAVVLARRPHLTVTGRLGGVARTTRRWRYAGLLVGLVAALASAQSGALGRGVLLAAPVLGVCVLLGVVLGETGVRAPAGIRRQASLVIRSRRSYLPRALTWAVGAATVLLGALLALTTATAGPDDLGRAGRALTRACSAVSAETRTPWPGSYYSLPLAAVVLAALVLAGLALTAVARRPQQGVDADLDDALRREAATGVVAAVGLLVTIPLVGVGTLASSGFLQVCAAPAAWTATGYLLLGVVPFAVGVGVWCLAALVVPGPVRVAEPADR